MHRFLVNKILPMSFVDGPGCRTAVFLQGCNISCSYCHNPETRRRCFNCGKCLIYCPSAALRIRDGKIEYVEKNCIHCDECSKHCRNYSSPKCQSYSPEQLLAKVEENALFIDGVTFSGGECSQQTEAIVEFCILAHKRKIQNIIVDTNCDVTTERLNKLLKHADGFIADLKGFDPVKYRILTGFDNVIVLKNIRMLAESRRLTEVRTVVVPGHNDNIGEIGACAQFINSLPGEFVWKLIAFRNFGVRGKLAVSPPLCEEQLEALAVCARSECNKQIIVV